MSLKWIFVLGLFLFTSLEARSECKVYGISDGPQNLVCDFKGQRVELTCKDSKYFLNNRPVLIAFHYEVENRNEPVPLVFKAEGMTLIAILDKNKTQKSELELKNKNIFGNCSKI
jgi:hypothetical protein